MIQRQMRLINQSDYSVMSTNQKTDDSCLMFDEMIKKTTRIFKTFRSNNSNNVDTRPSSSSQDSPPPEEASLRFKPVFSYASVSSPPPTDVRVMLDQAASFSVHLLLLLMVSVSVMVSQSSSASVFAPQSADVTLTLLHVSPGDT